MVPVRAGVVATAAVPAVNTRGAAVASHEPSAAVAGCPSDHVTRQVPCSSPLPTAKPLTMRVEKVRLEHQVC